MDAFDQWAEAMDLTNNGSIDHDLNLLKEIQLMAK
jgi:hypothetical protein